MLEKFSWVKIWDEDDSLGNGPFAYLGSTVSCFYLLGSSGRKCSILNKLFQKVKNLGYWAEYWGYDNRIRYAALSQLVTEIYDLASMGIISWTRFINADKYHGSLQLNLIQVSWFLTQQHNQIIFQHPLQLFPVARTYFYVQEENNIILKFSVLMMGDVKE